MSVRLIGIVIGLLVADFYGIQLGRLAGGRAAGPAGQSPATAKAIAASGLLSGRGVAAWWFLS